MMTDETTAPATLTTDDVERELAAMLGDDQEEPDAPEPVMPETFPRPAPEPVMPETFPRGALDAATLYVLRWLGEPQEDGTRPRMYFGADGGDTLDDWQPRAVLVRRWSNEADAAAALDRLQSMGLSPAGMMGGTVAVVPRRVTVRRRVP